MVGSADLRKCEYKNKTGGNWENFLFPFSFFPPRQLFARLAFSPFSSSFSNEPIIICTTSLKGSKLLLTSHYSPQTETSLQQFLRLYTYRLYLLCYLCLRFSFNTTKVGNVYSTLLNYVKLIPVKLM